MNQQVKPKILGIITARGGSKGIPRKNIIPILGKPLIYYTIDAALKSNFITKTIVSSDDKKILEISKFYGAHTLKRPKSLSEDTTSSEDVILHTLKHLKSKGEKYDYFILLQPTSPLRTCEDIDNALLKLIENNASAIISVVNIGVKPFKSYYLNNTGFLQGVHNNKTPNMRRQNLPDAYLANGAIYTCNVDEFLLSGSLTPVKTLPYLMTEDNSIDIDVASDIEIIETRFRRKNLTGLDL